MKRLLTYFLSAMLLLAVGCAEEFDDSKIWDKLNSLENRVTALEQLCKQMNTNISSLQKIVEALQNNDYVTNVAPITEDGKVVGYVITFSKSGSITIYHGKDGANGKDGADGYTPVIGVAKDSDGVYYWTLDGDWLLDQDGNKVKAEGVDGKDGQDGVNGTDGENGADGANGQNGKDGITPKLKIEDGYWYISYDNGVTWEELGKATGEDGENGAAGKDGQDGDSMFKDVTYDDEYVYITLTDGSKIIIPRVPPIPTNEIWYTSTDGKIVTPYYPDAFGANIVSNEYENGKGIIRFDEPITSIGYGAFAECSTLTNITIPDGVTFIDDYVFFKCSSLTNITVPDGVTSIGEAVFAYCTSLTNITVPNGVTSIGVYAFYACTSLTSITIPDGVTSIGNKAFIFCSSLTSITIPDGVTSIGVEVFKNSIQKSQTTKTIQK